MEIAIVLCLLLVVVILFSTEKLGVDVVTGLMLITLVMTGVVSTEEAFAAFGSDFIVILAAIFVITSAIERSGVLDDLAARVGRSKAAKLTPLLIWLLPFTALLSAFMNNTTVTALLIAPVLALTRKSGLPGSKVLMAVAFASIVGGSCTLIGTSTNIAVSAYLEKHRIATIGMFEFTGIGIALTVITLVYMLTIGRWLLPLRNGGGATQRATTVRRYTTEIRVQEGSAIIGTQVGASALTESGFEVLSILREGRLLSARSAGLYRAQDVAVVQGDITTLLAAREKNGITVMADELQEGQAAGSPLKLVEVLLPARSHLVGRTVKQARLLEQYGLAVAAVHRAGEPLRERIGRIQLQVGDMLLVQGTEEAIADFHDQHELVLLDEFTPDPKRVRKGYLTMLLFIAAVVAGTIGVVPLVIAFVAAALSTVLLGINDPRTVYTSIDWRLIVLIGGMTALGTAMTNSGADVFLSERIQDWFGGLGTAGILAGFMLLTVLLTQPMSNAAAALVVLPIASRTAEVLGASPVTFALAIMLSASVSLITPFEPSCILVYGPGRYRFSDFVRVGAPLTLVLLVVIYFGVQRQWPL
ncbi:MAG: SLC13 family permease [Flavobacteriales bacterium]|nr:SLC13 family permease [Flavobacteriales bacterium]